MIPREIISAATAAVYAAALGCTVDEPRVAEGGSDVDGGTTPAVDTLAIEFDHTAELPSLDDAHTASLTLGRVMGDSASLGRVISMEAVDPFLVLGDDLMPPHLKVIDLVSGVIVHQFGRDGEGPGEIRLPLSISRVAGREPAVEVFGMANQRIQRWTLDRPTGEASLAVETPFRAGARILFPIRVGDSYLAATNATLDYTLAELDTLGAETGQLYLHRPYTEEDGPAWAVARFNNAFLGSRSERDRFVLAYSSVNRIDILTGSGGPYRSVAGPISTTVKFEINEEMAGLDYELYELAYNGLATTDRYIYALFAGYSAVGMDPKEAPLPHRVHVFTWDGEFVGQLELDHEVRMFEISDDDRLLWGAYEDPQPRIGEWELPEWLTAVGQNEKR